jgi:lactoylglutathione lyase
MTDTKTKLGGVIVYVPEVETALVFWERAFGLTRGFVSPGGTYGELAGAVPIGFAAESFVDSSLPRPASRNRPDATPAGIEIALVTADVDRAYARAVEAGCEGLVAPHDKPWGQRLGYVREVHGVLVEICTAWS